MLGLLKVIKFEFDFVPEIYFTPFQGVEDLAIDVLIAERRRIARVFVPEFQANIGSKTNEELLLMPGNERC